MRVQERHNDEEPGKCQEATSGDVLKGQGITRKLFARERQGVECKQGLCDL
ncbi:hypothetical protein BADSM9389_41530 [Buttiauxella agrestis]|nr:hypothetical protein BADSM9389_41530 [Buttiauxella agrestis]